MKVVLATHNKNKLVELRDILKEFFNEIISLEELHDYDEIVENGNSFIENALIKAKHISLKYNCISIADDSGIEIDALNNAPGIYSARYSGLGDIENNNKVLRELENVTNRNARFISGIVIYYPNGDYHTFIGAWNGTVSKTAIYKNGFGYDAIFIPEGYTITASQMAFDEKNRISHRFIALQKLIDYLKIDKKTGH